MAEAGLREGKDAQGRAAGRCGVLPRCVAAAERLHPRAHSGPAAAAILPRSEPPGSARRATARSRYAGPAMSSALRQRLPSSGGADRLQALRPGKACRPGRACRPGPDSNGSGPSMCAGPAGGRAAQINPGRREQWQHARALGP
jgi:hypothetical protein